VLLASARSLHQNAQLFLVLPSLLVHGSASLPLSWSQQQKSQAQPTPMAISKRQLSPSTKLPPSLLVLS